MNDELSKKVQERIDAGNIMPAPRWRFFLLRGSLWLLAALSVAIGSLAVGVMLFLFADYRRHGLPLLPHDAAEFLAMVPVVWIILLVLFTAITRISITHTRRGYRYRLRTIVFGVILLSVVGGSVLEYAGIGGMAHELLNENPLYNSATYDSKDVWNRPVIGRLAGVIVAIQDDSDFSLMDFGGHVWQVRLASSTDGSFVPEASSTVRMFGLIDASSGVFVARSIHEWEEEE